MLAFWRQEPLQEFAVPPDDREHIVEIMCDTARQLSDSFHFLCLLKLAFQSLALGDIAGYEKVHIRQNVASRGVFDLSEFPVWQADFARAGGRVSAYNCFKL